MIFPSALALTTSPAKALLCFSSSPLTHGDYFRLGVSTLTRDRKLAYMLNHQKLQNSSMSRLLVSALSDTIKGSTKIHRHL